MTLIDKDKLWTRLQQYEDFECPATTSAFDTIADFRILLNTAAVVDAVPVVRCMDCVYKERATVNKKGYLICPASGMEITDRDYCSYGERREDHETD